jgi:hypothetical protein
MNSIPVMGTAIVNGVHWLQRLIHSIDYPVDKFIIINNNGRDQITKELDSLKDLNKKYIKHTHICHLPSNIGCAGAWNLIIKSSIMNPYWIIVNHDVAFTPKFLETMVEKAKTPSTGMVFGQPGKWNIGMWDIFLIKDWVVQKWGLFDENYYPAYCEDLDYVMRLLNFPSIREYVNLPYLHGETYEYSESGSQTIKSDINLKNLVDVARWINENVYMNNKWGKDWRYLNVPKYPFNNNSLADSNYSKYDLDFIRSKYTGF